MHGRRRTATGADAAIIILPLSATRSGRKDGVTVVDNVLIPWSIVALELLVEKYKSLLNM